MVRTLEKKRVAVKLGRPCSHPWSKWFQSRGWITLVHGRSFTGRLDTFIQALRNQASMRGLSIRTRVEADGAILKVLIQERRAG